MFYKCVMNWIGIDICIFFKLDMYEIFKICVEINFCFDNVIGLDLLKVW